MLTPRRLLDAYGRGIFPMAVSRADPRLHWFEPDMRGVIPLDGLHISRSLRRAVAKGDYRISVDTAFEAVVASCAARKETWINDPLAGLYASLHSMGHAHSLELWADGGLAGGIFGVTLGGAFFGESMFSARRDASKIAMVHLVDRLRRGGFSLFDTQYITPHLASLGGIEIPRAAYRVALETALERQGDFRLSGSPPEAGTPQSVLQRMTQIS